MKSVYTRVYTVYVSLMNIKLYLNFHVTIGLACMSPYFPSHTTPDIFNKIDTATNSLLECPYDMSLTIKVKIVG